MTTTALGTQTSTGTGVAARKSLPLTARDVAALKKLLGSAAHKAALRGMVRVDKDSESQVLHALVVLGLRAVEEQVEEASYAAMAADPEYQAYAQETRQAARRRR